MRHVLQNAPASDLRNRRPSICETKAAILGSSDPVTNEHTEGRDSSIQDSFYRNGLDGVLVSNRRLTQVSPLQSPLVLLVEACEAARTIEPLHKYARLLLATSCSADLSHIHSFQSAAGQLRFSVLHVSSIIRIFLTQVTP